MIDGIFEDCRSLDEQGAKDWKYWVGLHLTKFNKLVNDVERATEYAIKAIDTGAPEEVKGSKFAEKVEKLSDLMQDVGDLFSKIYKEAKEQGIKIE